MAYNNSYSGYGTYPFPNYTGNFAQSYGQSPYQLQPQSFQQPQQPTQPSNGSYFYVNGVEGAKAFMVMPNSQAILFDSDSNKFFIKTANAQGQATMKEFEYSEINAPNSPKTNETRNSNTFITRKEFDEFRGKLNAILNKPKEEPKHVQFNANN